MGFKPGQTNSSISSGGNNASRKNKSQQNQPEPQLLSPRRLKPMDTSVALPSARSANMSHHLQKLKQKLDTQETRQRAILARAEEMFVDRKRFGGTLNRKEASSWSSFMSNLKAPTKKISPLTGELDPQVANVSLTRFDSVPRPKSSGVRRRTRLAKTRSFVADKNRRAANRAAIVAERKQLLLGGREPPFWTTSAAQLQLGGRSATFAHNLYGTPVDDLVPRYGSVSDLPVYDAPHWEEESGLNVREVMAPLPDQEGEDPKAMYHTAYRLSYKTGSEEEISGAGGGGGEGEEEGGEEGTTREMCAAEVMDENGANETSTPQLGSSSSAHYVLIPELNVSKTAALSNDVDVDQSSDIIRKLEMEAAKIQTTARMTGRGINKSRGRGGGTIPMSSRRSSRRSQSRQSIRMR
jgi:hypothetical protein